MLTNLSHWFRPAARLCGGADSVTGLLTHGPGASSPHVVGVPTFLPTLSRWHLQNSEMCLFQVLISNSACENWKLLKGDLNFFLLNLDIRYNVLRLTQVGDRYEGLSIKKPYPANLLTLSPIASKVSHWLAQRAMSYGKYAMKSWHIEMRWPKSQEFAAELSYFSPLFFSHPHIPSFFFTK